MPIFPDWGVDTLTHDYDLHGLARMRVVDATAAEVAAVGRQLGPIGAPVGGRADIVVRFVDRLALSSPVRYVGRHDAGFTDDAFLVLGDRRRAGPRVQLPFADLGGPEPVELLCERGLGAVPLLVPILNLTVLGKGALALHGTAFVYRGTGVVTTGWARAGKTQLLLAFLERGAEYVGDEWVYVTGDGRQVCGIPEPVRVRASHLRSLPRLEQRLTTRERARLAAISAALARRRVLGRAVSFLERRHYVDLAAERLAGRPLGPLSTSFDRLLLMMSDAGDDVRVEPTDGDDVAARMAWSLAYERQEITGWYHRFRFAFPDASNPSLEQADERERAMLRRVCAGKQAWVVRHPYSMAIPALYDAVAPLC